MKKIGKIKTFLILEIFKKKVDIVANRLIVMRTKYSIIVLDLIIFQKLLKIFILIIQINHNFKQKIIKEYKIIIVKKSKNIYSKNLVFK